MSFAPLSELNGAVAEWREADVTRGASRLVNDTQAHVDDWGDANITDRLSRVLATAQSALDEWETSNTTVLASAAAESVLVAMERWNAANLTARGATVLDALARELSSWERDDGTQRAAELLVLANSTLAEVREASLVYTTLGAHALYLVDRVLPASLALMAGLLFLQFCLLWWALTRRASK